MYTIQLEPDSQDTSDIHIPPIYQNINELSCKSNEVIDCEQHCHQEAHGLNQTTCFLITTLLTVNPVNDITLGLTKGAVHLLCAHNKLSLTSISCVHYLYVCVCVYVYMCTYSA